MAAGSRSAPAQRSRGRVGALWDRARGLWRRRAAGGLVVLVGCGAVAATPLVARGGAAAPNRASSAAAPSAAVASRGLPALGQFPALSVAAGRLIVSDTDNMTFARGRVLGTCTAVSVSPVSLRVTAVSRGNCGDPALYGRRILPVVYRVNPRPGPAWGTDELGIRIARVDRAAPGGYTLGPLLVGYPDCSDCRAQMIYGPGALWVYAPLTTPGAPGELFRIATATGRVTHRWVIPEMLRALLATDADGLWFAPGTETCCAGPRSPWARQKALYHVAPGAAAPVRKLAVGQLGASWLVASGHNVWIERRTRAGSNGAASIWRLDRPTARPTLISARARDGCADLGEGQGTVLGGSMVGIYCVASGASSQQVIRLDPGGDSAVTVATVPSMQQYASPDSAVLFHGAYYFLDPPSTTSPAEIYRVTALASTGRRGR